jgi:branched-subunit amino acid transport protein
MPVHKVDLTKRIIHWFTYHPWLKLTALILAILVWLYVGGELQKFNY